MTFVLQKLIEQRELERRKREAEESKQRENFKLTPPVSSPEKKGKTMPGTSIVVMPPVPTDDVIYPDVLETDKLSYVPKLDGLSVSVPR
jgi:hypothetical protein